MYVALVHKKGSSKCNENEEDVDMQREAEVCEMNVRVGSSDEEVGGPRVFLVL